jgi:cytochrome c553
MKYLALIIGAAIVSPLVISDAFAADPKVGERLYREHCIRCHGAAGEGTKKHPQPLVGDKPLGELSKVIDKTMPEDDPDKLDAGQSADVAAYIYDAFYSPAAQARNKPARIELSRLTVSQYRNSIADLVGTFRGPVKWDGKRGLHGEYFSSRGFQGNKRVIDRLDSEVRFDFGTVAPGEKFDAPHTFAIRWEGSVLPMETGTYEFVVRTDHAMRLWVNNPKTPLIDAWVKSGNDTEYRASIFLLAGRPYSVRLEFSKAKQGVDDSKKNPNPPPVKASIALLWKPPHSAAGVIPARQLSPVRAPEAFLVSAPFPPDDRSLGWERGTTISKDWDAATTDAALETAGYVVSRLGELAGVSEMAKDRLVRLKDFATRFAERAFRRPLTAEEKKAFIDRQFEVTPDPELAIKRVVVLVLKSPRFLYRELAEPDAYAIASRLAFALWDAPPDEELLKAAAAGKLSTRGEVAAHAERMLADPRARAKMRAFLFNWLKVDQPHDLAKDPKRFPGFSASIASDLRMSLDLFLDDTVWSKDSDFRKLLLADTIYLNGSLKLLYGVDEAGPPEPGFTPVALDTGRRAGVLTHPYLLSTFAYTAESSPIHRGVFIARGILGVTLRPPQDAFTPLPADLHPTLTTRERVALQTKPAACITCHGVINPLGFTLENFDAIGQYRERENGKPINASGSYQTKVGSEAKFTGPVEMAKYLASSDEVHAAFVEKLFHHTIKQPVRAYGPQKLDELRKTFVQGNYNMRKLLVEIAVAGAMPKSSKQ